MLQPRELTGTESVIARRLAVPLVVAQFSLLLAIAAHFLGDTVFQRGFNNYYFPAEATAQPGSASLLLLIPAICLALAGLAFGIWAVLSLPARSLSATPVPRANNQLVIGGPYRLVRHPMYSALLAIALAIFLARPSATGLLLGLALGAVLVAKLRVEETLLEAKHSDYLDYKARTPALLPDIRKVTG